VAVYERTYRPYNGTRTPQWSRFLILPRYGLKRLFSSRIVLAYFVACQIPFLVGLAMVYITNNLELLQKIGIEFDADTIEFIGVAFFRRIFWIQGMGMGFILMMIVGPGLISSDTANNALPLYFSRPFTRLEYVLGKASLPLLLMSGLTWIPQAILFILQSSMKEGWFAENVRLGAGLFVGSWVWIVVLTLMTLAISASVKRKLTAMIYVFAVFMVLPIFGEMIHFQLGLWWGSLLSPIDMMLNALSTLYGGVRAEPDVPVAASWAAVAAYGLTSAWVLRRKLQAYEVVR
jgi:ABC-2 type transport system permease protein